MSSGTTSRSSRPPASSPDALRRMRSQSRRETVPELDLRSQLHRRGRRFRVHYPVAGTRRTVDIAFPRLRVAVFVDGCFWHGCPSHGTTPKANGAWWRDKIAANVARDRDTDTKLEQRGWRVVRVWEHENVEASADRVDAALRESTELRSADSADEHELPARAHPVQMRTDVVDEHLRKPEGTPLRPFEKASGRSLRER